MSYDLRKRKEKLPCCELALPELSATYDETDKIIRGANDFINDPNNGLTDPAARLAALNAGYQQILECLNQAFCELLESKCNDKCCEAAAQALHEVTVKIVNRLAEDAKLELIPPNMMAPDSIRTRAEMYKARLVEAYKAILGTVLCPKKRCPPKRYKKIKCRKCYRKPDSEKKKDSDKKHKKCTPHKKTSTRPSWTSSSSSSSRRYSFDY